MHAHMSLTAACACVCVRVWVSGKKREREKERAKPALSSSSFFWCSEANFLKCRQRRSRSSSHNVASEPNADPIQPTFFSSPETYYTHDFWGLSLSLSDTHSYSHISLFLFIRVCVHEEQQQQGEEEAAAGDSNDRAAMRWEFGSKARETKISIQVTHRAQSRRRAEASFPFFKWCHWNDNLFRRQQKRTRLLLLKKTSLIITTEWPFRDFHKKEDQEEEKGGIILSPEVTRSLRRLIR